MQVRTPYDIEVRVFRCSTKIQLVRFVGFYVSHSLSVLYATSFYRGASSIPSWHPKKDRGCKLPSSSPAHFPKKQDGTFQPSSPSSLEAKRDLLNRRSRILLKLENLQPSGSFKSRGIGHFCQRALAKAARPDAVHYYSSSGGNAGLACVHAANFLKRPCTVVVPMSTKPMMIARIRAAGASEVVQFGVSWKEADQHLREVVVVRAEGRGEEAVYVPPFDHEDVWDGHKTLVDELCGQLGEMGERPPEVMVCSVGGGGLFNGIVQGVQEAGDAWAGTTVLAMETLGADSLHQALVSDELVTLQGITSQATSLGATRVSQRTFDLARNNKSTVKSVVLTDAEAAMGCWRLADHERLLVELACGVNVAVCFGGRLEKALGRRVQRDEKVVIVVCGGSNVTVNMVAGWRHEFGDLDDPKDGSAKMTNGHAVPNGHHAELKDQSVVYE